MAQTSRPLWKLLLESAGIGRNTSLTCSDCFAILQYLADASITGVDRMVLLGAARQHLNKCPDCQEYYQQRLDELESLEVEPEQTGKKQHDGPHEERK